MVGSIKPLVFSRSAYERRYADPQFRELFDWDFDTIAKTYLASPKATAEWVGPGPIMTDDKPTVEYFLSVPPDDHGPDLSMIVRRPEEIVRP